MQEGRPSHWNQRKKRALKPKKRADIRGSWREKMLRSLYGLKRAVVVHRPGTANATFIRCRERKEARGLSRENWLRVPDVGVLGRGGGVHPKKKDAIEVRRWV